MPVVRAPDAGTVPGVPRHDVTCTDRRDQLKVLPPAVFAGSACRLVQLRATQAPRATLRSNPSHAKGAAHA